MRVGALGDCSSKFILSSKVYFTLGSRQLSVRLAHQPTHDQWLGLYCSCVLQDVTGVAIESQQYRVKLFAVGAGHLQGLWDGTHCLADHLNSFVHTVEMPADVEPGGNGWGNTKWAKTQGVKEAYPADVYVCAVVCALPDP